jgi:hypothetical protein
MTYLKNYTCHEVEILESGDGKTTMDYGDDLLLISAMMNCIEYPEMFNDLPQSTKITAPKIANKVLFILIAGSIAESVYLNNGIVNDDMKVELSGPDLIRVDNINYLLSSILKNHPANFIEKMMQDILMIFSLEEVWNSISVLAETILKNEHMMLTKEEIEHVLAITGYFDFINNI